MSTDLSALERPRTVSPPPRSKLRYLLPALLLVGFATALVWAFRDTWRDPVPVTILRPRADDGATSVSTGQVILQAAGWVEPDPYPLDVTALTRGTLAEMLVDESDVVRKGDLIAKLVEEDARLLEGIASAALSEAQASAHGARAEHQRRLKAAEEQAASLRVLEEALTLQRHLAAEGAAGPRQVELAQARLAEARAALESRHAEAELAASDIARTQATILLREQELAAARLRLERTEVRSPFDGVVLERHARPGTVVHGHEGATIPIVTLYDPAHLRVRVDVPQESVARLRPGLAAEFTSESRRGRSYQGEVSRLIHRADIQKVTLEVQVRVLDPDEWLRPEMLCQVRFLGEPSADERPATAASRLWIPARLVSDGAVWVVSPDGRHAEKRPVTLGDERGDDVLVRSGLDLSQKLIDSGREALDEGTLITIRE
ncbi:MAG: efflux RND transporter periplasmic adaptor subunit [Planctomycetota bacterium]